jgi:flagellar basal-body rod protein FlgB
VLTSGADEPPEHGALTSEAKDRPSRIFDGWWVFVFDSVSSVALHSALNGLALRQRVIADNVANIQTPNFHAGKVNFEAALADAVANGNGAVTPTVGQSLEPAREDGNNVNLDEETLSNVDTNLRYQLATQAVDFQFSSIASALKTN